jgi:hypothetical protein
LKVRDGRALMKSFYSHHYCLMTGSQATDIENMGRVMQVGIESL